MTPLRILIVDDETPARNRLRDVLADCATEMPVMVVEEAGSGKMALEWLESHAVDVALLDIHMPVMDGIELARHMQRLPAPPAIVFSTAFDQHAIEAFEVNAVDYLLKPVRKERLLAALRKAQAFAPERLGALAQQSRKHLSVSERGKIILIPVEDIVYLRAEQKYVTIRTLAREFLSEESLTHLEQEFAPRFLRIHRNCIVAREYVAGFEKQGHGEDAETGASPWVAVLRGLEERLPISRRHRYVVRGIGKD
ncbi:MAG: LytTR family DNA-binding domain-containing protein [Sulfuricella sp.]|jgi:two-component system response regulator AlgR|nr:LytTR family DNA-binding domain-containing protein [Sulfuricella sp.]